MEENREAEKMRLKPNSTEPAHAPAPNLFCEARLLELMSIARRVGANPDQGSASAPRTAAAFSIARPSTEGTQDDRSIAMFHLAIGPGGWWELREHKGTKAGLFRTRQAAIKYARDESPNGQFVIIDDVA